MIKTAMFKLLFSYEICTELQFPIQKKAVDFRRKMVYRTSEKHVPAHFAGVKELFTVRTI